MVMGVISGSGSEVPVKVSIDDVPRSDAPGLVEQDFQPTIAQIVGLVKDALAAGDFARVHDLRRSIFERDPNIDTRMFFLNSLILNGDLMEALDFFFETVEFPTLAAGDLSYMRSLASKLSLKIKQAIENKTLGKKDSKKCIEWLAFIHKRLNVHRAMAVDGRASEISMAIQTALESGAEPGPQEHIRAARYLQVDSLNDESLRGVDMNSLKKALRHFMTDNQMHAAYTLATYISTRDPMSSLARYVVAKYLLQAEDSHFSLVTILGAQKMHASSSDAAIPNLQERIDEFIGSMLLRRFPALENVLHKIVCAPTYNVAAKSLAGTFLTQPNKTVYRVELAYELKRSGHFEDALLIRSALLQNAKTILEIDPENESAQKDVEICTKEIAEIQEKLS